MFVLVIIASCLMATSMRLGFQPAMGDGVPLWLITVLHFYANTLVYCPPVNVLAHTIVTYSLRAIHLALSKYEDRLKQVTNTGQVAKAIEAGFQLEKTVRHANDVFAGFLLVEYAITAMVQICCLYFSVGLVEALIEQHFMPTEILFASQAVFCVVVSTMVRADLVFSGNKIAAIYGSIRRSLQDILSKACRNQDLSETTKADLDILLERYTNEAPISPFGAFNVTISSGLNLDGIIITYIIVLLQFRLSG